MPEKLVKEWIAKAEEDYKTVLTLNRQRKNKLPNSICFHCQQCIEKYLKAFLIYNESEPPRTHDLRKLNDVAASFDSSLKNIYDFLEQLNPYSVEFRYPGSSATLKEAKQAVQVMKKARGVLIKKFIGIRQPKLWK
ncbi:MAG: HEPN domain-containing protein [Nitrospiraceae bacterium]|nr:MAG: HEPN domain-containing protein [Nitrospiraceae bacterium]